MSELLTHSLWCDVSCVKYSKMQYQHQYYNKQLLEDSPSIVGDWITFTTTDYATRERRTHATVRVSHISSIDENYDLERYGNRNWCTVNMSNGKSNVLH